MRDRRAAADMRETLDIDTRPACAGGARFPEIRFLMLSVDERRAHLFYGDPPPDIYLVITSYSIHYTKLYDACRGDAKVLAIREPFVDQAVERGILKLFPPGGVGEVLGVLGLEAEFFGRVDFGRITSYNVCYTKLLRYLPPEDTSAVPDHWRTSAPDSRRARPCRR